MDGNGQSELIKCITGLLPADSGSVQIGGEECRGASAHQILRKGVSHIPEDRLKMAAVSEMSVNENMMLMSCRSGEFLRGGLLRHKLIRQHNDALCREYDVRFSGLDEPFRALSGGNQQKVVVARELSRKPDLLIAVHPDRGLDIGATKYIQSRILEERERGAAVLMVSTELEEIMELSDRVIVLFEGRIMARLDSRDATAETLGSLMAGVVPACLA